MHYSSTTEDTTGSHTTCRHNACAFILQSVYGHDAPYAIVGYKYIVQGHCSLTHWPEWEMLCKETAKSVVSFILQNIIYHWGTLLEIVTDNGAPFVKVLAYLSKRYHITHICISGYNSCANGLVECSHFDVHETLFKVCDREENKWSASAYLVFWVK